MTKIFIYTVLFFLILAEACENELKIDMPQAESKMVVEGWIEQGKGPKVLVSLSAPFFTEIDSSTLRDYAVTTAKITVFSDDESEILTLKPNDVYFPPYYYFGSDIKGKLNNKYSIEILFRGKTYTAKTTIPNLVKPDSVWFDRDDENDTLGLIVVRIKDNPVEKNYYRTLTRVIGKDKKFIPTFTSVFSDESFNGKTLDIPLSRGNSTVLDIENSRFFTVGDTIILKFCSIDKAHYDFWNTMQAYVQASGNPFMVNNSDVKSNIEEGFGIWGGYAAAYDTIYTK